MLSESSAWPDEHLSLALELVGRDATDALNTSVEGATVGPKNSKCTCLRGIVGRSSLSAFFSGVEQGGSTGQNRKVVVRGQEGCKIDNCP